MRNDPSIMEPKGAPTPTLTHLIPCNEPKEWEFTSGSWRGNDSRKGAGHPLMNLGSQNPSSKRMENTRLGRKREREHTLQIIISFTPHKYKQQHKPNKWLWRISTNFRESQFGGENPLSPAVLPLRWSRRRSFPAHLIRSRRERCFFVGLYFPRGLCFAPPKTVIFLVVRFLILF